MSVLSAFGHYRPCVQQLRKKDLLHGCCVCLTLCVYAGIELEWRKTQCMPREVCVDVGREFGAPTNIFYKPPCVSVYRCGGCCHSEDKQCRNISTGYLSKTVSTFFFSSRSYYYVPQHGSMWKVWSNQHSIRKCPRLYLKVLAVFLSSLLFACNLSAVSCSFQWCCVIINWQNGDIQSLSLLSGSHLGSICFRFTLLLKWQLICTLFSEHCDSVHMHLTEVPT